MGLESIIALLFPSFIALKLYNYLRGGNLRVSDLVQYYFIFVTLITLFAYVAVVFVFNEPDIVMTPIFFTKYLIISVLLAVVLPLAVRAVAQGVSITIDERKRK